VSEQGTEQATPQRKQKAKEKGDVVRSRELVSASSMLGGVMMLGITTHELAARWGNVYLESLRSATVGELNGEQAVKHMIAPVVGPVGMVLLASFVCALFAGVIQSGGVRLHFNAVEPKFTRLNPAMNLKNLFSLRSGMQLVKSLVPAAMIVGMGWATLKAVVLPIPAMSMLRLPVTFSTAYSLTVKAAWVMLLWSGLDYAVEWRSWNQRLKMSKQQIREEMKEAMGNPEVKGKIRQIQRAMRKRKIKADLSRASVVITNPTHYAVALEFSFETMQAPVVLAKGRDLLANDIREEARWAGIPIIENPPLARSLYRMVDPGQAIPFELYSTVAGILAYLYRQKMEQKMRGDRPSQMTRSYSMVAGMRGFGGGM
jgi:flagellar biosynthetic protein FlhB